MNSLWSKTTDLVLQGNTAKETWTRKDQSFKHDYQMDIYLGKKMDMTTLKEGIIQSLEKQLHYHKESRTNLYSAKNTEPVENCMITGISTEKTLPVATIYGAEYVQTPDTGHVYVKKRPVKKAIEEFYQRSESYSSTYTDKASSEVRLKSIGQPWAEWMIDVYVSKYGKRPKRVLDVGAGGGHFVEACKRLGLEAKGIELSDHSCAFAKATWDITLDNRDFTKVYEEYAGYDIVTFWGLLEHTPNPVEIASCAKKVVEASANGMVVAKLPRWNSLTSAAQRLNPDKIIRHIDPAGHIMLFSDASAAELFVRSGLSPCGAWYFGMDAYETFMQLGNYTGEYASFLKSGKFQMELQQYIDENRFSDNFAIVGVPK